ncbi:MAG: DUF2207 domain-containing protein [Methanosarcinaceae archaeon]|nr:DUF2207 domain-containing protein [Methanosarcinaceae archaeon]
MGKKHKDKTECKNKAEYKNNTEYKNEYKKNILLVLSITFLISILFVCPVFGFEQSTLEQMQIDEFDKNFGFLKTSIPTLHSEKIYVKINEDGSADIVSFRKCTMTKGTENFIPINNLGKSKISNFTVSEYGKVYEKMDYWDINASMSEKAYRSGVVITDSGYELYWGISEYGDHNYKISYHVSDFVKETKDSQIIFWRFINDKTNIPPETATVVIEAPWDFDFKDSRIWAFGYEGTIDFVDGKIVAKSSETFLDRSYLTVLADFPKLTNTNDILEKTTEEIIKGAFVGSDYVYNAAVISNVDVNVTLHNDLTASFKQKYNIILDYGRNISVPLIIKNESDVKNIEVYEKFLGKRHK